MSTNQSKQVLSECGIEMMRIMATDEQKSWMLVHRAQKVVNPLHQRYKQSVERLVMSDDVCMGGLVMVLSNDDQIIVNSALQTILKLSEWPNLRLSLRNFLGMQNQLSELMSATATPAVKETASKIYNLLYPPSPSLLDDTFQSASVNDTTATMESRKDAVLKRRKNSFFVGGALKAKTVVLQIRGLIDKDDMEICRSQLITVTGVISITFDFRKKRAVVRVKHDLNPELLAIAIAKTMTMSAEQVIKNEDGTEVMLPLYVPVDAPPVDEMPDYPSDIGSPVTGNQNIARRGDSDSKSWGLLQSIGSFISNSFYW